MLDVGVLEMNDLRFSHYFWLAVMLGGSWCAAQEPLGTEESGPAGDSTLLRAIAQYEAAMEAESRDVRVRDFGLAEQLFRQAIEAQPAANRSASMYVNLGNAALQAEHLGPAILAFRRALALDPSHIQAQQNLRFARLLVPESLRPESTGGLVNTLFFWNTIYSRTEIGGLAALCFLLAAALFASGLGLRQPLLRNLAIIPAIAWCICLVSISVGEAGREADPGVIVASEAVLRSADSENAPPRLSEVLISGVEVEILRTRERWTEIEIPGGRTGWVLRSAVESLSRPR